VPQVIEALNSAFYMGFDAIEPTGKAHLLALDVSGSMGSGEIAGIPGLTPRDVSAALAMATARTEKNYMVIGFCGQLVQLPITASQRLDDAVKIVSGLPFGPTDCAVPMLAALENNLEVDVFHVYTDNETWCGQIHPFQALKSYREKTGRGAKLAVLGMVANQFTIADPSDPGMLEV
jgi:60 kDa SS-A/Ro ribonucleoprotein